MEIFHFKSYIGHVKPSPKYIHNSFLRVASQLYYIPYPDPHLVSLSPLGAPMPPSDPPLCTG